VKDRVMLNVNREVKIRYSIVMTAYNRQQQLDRTLESFKHHKYSSDVEVIIVDDGSYEPVTLENLVGNEFIVRLVRIDQASKWYINPCVPFNIGLKQARGEAVIIQNAECLHKDNLIDYLDLSTTILSSAYLSFACYSLDEIQSSSLGLQEFNNFNKTSAGMDGSSGWYNHSIYRPAGYHFCAAIKRKNLVNIGYFDETYAMGVAFDDDEFLYRVRKNLDFRIVDDYVVLHQWHYSGGNPHKPNLFLRNRVLFRFYTRWRIPAWIVLNLIFPMFVRFPEWCGSK
jgi:GT2 family glycosyltransferase